MWLSKTEMAQIVGAARYEGMAVSAWLGAAGVRVATRADATAADPVFQLKELMDVHVGLVAVRNELGRVGGNLNQIARYANTTGLLPVAAPRVVAQAKQTVRRVDDALVELRWLMALARPAPYRGTEPR